MAKRSTEQESEARTIFKAAFPSAKQRMEAQFSKKSSSTGSKRLEEIKQKLLKRYESGLMRLEKQQKTKE